VRRRTFLRLVVLGGVAMAHSPRIMAGTRRASPYGRWVSRHGVPAFIYDADHETLPGAEWDPIIAPRTRRHWLLVGNTAIRLQGANDGTVAVFDESEGLRWLVAPDPGGSGVSVVIEADGRMWGTDYAARPAGPPPLRTFGPTWFEVRASDDGLTLTRTILCPEGAVPWVVLRVRLTLAVRAAGPRVVEHRERWALRPRFLSLLVSDDQRRAQAERAVAYDVTASGRRIVASERFAAGASLFGSPAVLVLERLAHTAGTASVAGSPHPTLEFATRVALRPGEARELWFRFGRDDGTRVRRPERVFARSLRTLATRLPRAAAPAAPEAKHEIPWHAALLTGGLAIDRVIGGHTLDQGSAYAYSIGFNGAARDPLQHALPLVYVDPALALSVLRNTCAWATPDGDLPYCLDAGKRPANLVFRPSDQNLWALWLAAEYAAATGDLGAFMDDVAYHPVRRADAVPLAEHLRRQFRFFVDVVGRGERGHVRILNADWNDVAIQDSGVDAAVMIERGSSVLNSAFASWVLGVFAGLADRLGDAALAGEARAQADELRGLVAKAWNGRWFHRAYAPGGGVVGDGDCWLEVQPWAILCGAADRERARALLATIDAGPRAGSPLGARLRWPPSGAFGEGTRGGIWYAVNMTLVWAAARVVPSIAWNEWRRMTLASHTAAYPDVWEGTLSGPDAWNAPESMRPGRTWAAPPLAMQAFPVNNMHSHAQPLLAYLRLLGIEPTARGTLAVGKGGLFRSRVLRLDRLGHGRLRVRGRVVLETAHGTVHGGAGFVAW
jgi:glycosyl hydrolase family 36